MMRSYISRIGALAATGTLLFALTRCAHESREKTAPPPQPSSSDPGDEAAARDALAATALGRVVSRDALGRARFILGGAQNERAEVKVNAETAARLHLSRHAQLLGLNDAEVRGATISATHALPGGASVVQFTQRVDGIDVFRARAHVVLDATRNLVSIGSTLRASGTPADGDRVAAASVSTASRGARTPKAKGFPATAEAAFAKAYATQFNRELTAGAVRDRGIRAASAGVRDDDIRSYSVVTPKGAPRVLDASMKRVFFPEGLDLTPAYYIEVLARARGSKENQAYGYVVSAGDARVLYRTSLTQNEAFQYRVWAETSGDHIPMDGPMVDYSPHPTGLPDKAAPGYRAPNLVSMEGFNKNPQGRADPWLGPTDTVTFGNNVRAYSDRNDTHELDDAGNTVGDGYNDGTDVRADVTAPLTFDRTYDVASEPNASPDQIKAAVTQMFYVTNWMHDYWYDSGFNEAAGVAQLVNYGRGGAEGDPLRAEAQDGADMGFANNANMATFADGTSPRMQMFVWNGAPNRKLETTPPLTFEDGYGAAAYGPQQFDLEGTAVLSDDGAGTPGTPTDGCQQPTNVSGQIAVIDRGTCDFVTKGKNAQAAGAIGILLLNHLDGHVAPSPGAAEPSITIPLMGLSKEDGQKLKDALGRGAVSVHLTRGAEVLHDGTIDNTVIAHEWGHYLHHRLVTCGAASCRGMSEGWADFNALLMSVREGDAIDGKAFPLAQYASAGLFADAAYFGIRRAPYSVDLTKNPFTFKHIKWNADLPAGVPLQSTSSDMSEVHNVGEIWAQMLFEGYANLQKAGQAASPPRSFQETKRRMADYVVAGMKATPIEPTFAEQRDALLGVVWAMGRKDDFMALAQGFAKRGLGVGAVAPPVESYSFDEVKESFSSGPDFALVDAVADDSVSSCDRDGVLDSGESGLLTVRVRNSGWSALAGTKVTVSSTEPSIQFDEGATATIQAAMEPFDVARVTIGIKADKTRLSRTEIPIRIALANDAAVSKAVNTVIGINYNYDDVPDSSVTETAESSNNVWTFVHGARALQAWTRQGDATNHVWRGADLGAASDESFVSPPLNVGNGDFAISFRHRYQFESGAAVPGGPEVFFDGGVFEISEDGGTTWKDVSTYTDPNYPQTLYAAADSTNVLKGRKAWAGTSPTYPNFDYASLTLGKALAGKTIKVRFRVASDESVGAPGWDVDNITFSGITNLPFPTIVDDRRACTTTPPPPPPRDGGTGGGGSSDAGSRGPDAGARTDAGGGGGGGGGHGGFGDPGGADAAAGGNPSGGGGGSSDDGGGCGCVTSPDSGAGTGPLMGVLGGLSMLLRRRRRGR